MKHLILTKQVINPLLLASALFALLSGCASTEMERRLENNFVYQCSLKLFDELGSKKINGADAEKICSAAHKSEMDEEARKNALLSPPIPEAATPAAVKTDAVAAPSASPAKSAIVAPVKSTPEVKDEIQPEPTPHS